MVKVSVFLFIFFVFSSSSFSYDGWSGANIVESVRHYSSGYVLIVMKGASNPSGCESVSYINLPQDGSEGRKKQYAALLSAYMSRQTVDLALTGCSSGGTSGYPVVEQVWLK